ncbi:hypothetical protein GALMADRAFT_81039, partial [Galerina marginata CBS 339.88]
YAVRGIPFRRGYLLHGVLGSSKSSLYPRPRRVAAARHIPRLPLCLLGVQQHAYGAPWTPACAVRVAAGGRRPLAR